MKKEAFLDPLYGRIVTDPTTQRLIFTPEFQRLRYVRLCNINSLYITGASEPKRFEHSLGVYYLATLWVKARKLSVVDARIVQAAALLHDLQTGPFGHSFQYILEDNVFEQQFEHSNLSSGVRSRYLQRAHAAASFAGQHFAVAKILGEISEPVFAAIRGAGPYGPIISGTVDLDNLDNVIRLGFHVGLCNDDDRTLPQRLAGHLHVRQGRLAAKGDVFRLFRRWFQIRRQLYDYLLLDRGEFSAKAMLTLAVERAVEASLLGPDSWKLTDEELLSELEERSVGQHQTIGQIVRRIRIGHLFECVGVWSTNETQKYGALSQAARKRQIEYEVQRIAVKSGAAKLRCCAHFILDYKKTCRALTYLDLTRNTQQTVGHDSKRLLIGIFITNNRSYPLSNADHERYVSAAREALGAFGLRVLEEAKDPLGSEANEQGMLSL